MLTSGVKLGPYEILSPLDAGGMGDVYRARDTKLNRDVALKVLPEAFANGAERVARFEHEAQVLASLNHPNIASIYGFEDSSCTGVPPLVIRALVMELVEGKRLPSASSEADSHRRGAPDGPANLRGAGIRARTRDRASGFETGERKNHARRYRKAAGFRTGEGHGE